MRMRAKDLAINRKLLADWTHPIGTPVVAMRVNEDEIRTRTLSAPWLQSGRAVVFLECKCGPFPLERLRLDAAPLVEEA